jgi:hypothetical protein
MVMTPKVLMVVFSTNRVEYLKKSLKSQQLIDTTGCKVQRILFDDYPNGRDDRLIKNICISNGYNSILHRENMGITKTWGELFDYVKEREFDYIWHMEDDVEIKHAFSLMDLISMLKEFPFLSQIQLHRNNWYGHETEQVEKRDTDIVWRNYRIQKGNPYFWMMASLYPAWIAKEYDREKMGAYPSEGMLAKFMKERNGSSSGLLKSSTGSIMVNHFGEYSRGRRVLEGEPGWEKFKDYDPNVDYNSRDGKVFVSN